MASPPLRRLIDLPGVADLEFKALMKPAYADPERRADYPEIDACAKSVFDLTAVEAESVQMPDELDPIAHLEPRDQVAAFEAAGWDVTDDKRRPLRMLRQLGPPLWLACARRGRNPAVRPGRRHPRSLGLEAGRRRRQVPQALTARRCNAVRRALRL